MHFSIPETEDFTDDSGSSYTGYHVYINGKFHCTVRYRQLHNLHEQLKKEYGAAVLPYFPPKKFLPLSFNQLEERRSLLEKFIQKVGQNPELVSSEIINGFLLSAQVETCAEKSQECSLDVFLMNGYQITVTVLSTERSHQVLEKVCRQLALPDAYVYYFYLFLIKDEDNGNITIVRKLQDFESPYISQQSLRGAHKIVLRKNYWDPAYDLELVRDRVALNLLYVQAVTEVECGWMLCNEEARQKLASLQAKGSKKEYMEYVRCLKFYGYMQFLPCVADYPFPGAPILVSIGNYELNIRLQTGSTQSANSNRAGVFKVTRMRCWRITTLHDNGENGNKSGPNFELSFEYLVAKDKLMWITISSEQAILMSICLQSMVDELLLKKNGAKRKMPGELPQKQTWPYMKRDGSSQVLSSSQSSSSDGFCSSVSSGGQSTSVSNISDIASPTRAESTSSSMKRLSEKFSNVNVKSTSGRNQFSTTTSLQTPPVENDAFDGIGDDDL